MDKIDKIRQLRTEYNSSNGNDRKQRLEALITKHGLDAVAEATGLTYSTLVTYSSSTTPRISEATLRQAETILSQL